jgi:hypothetical protein
LAVILFGLAFDRWGSYDPAYAVSVGLLVVAAALALTIRERELSARYSPVVDDVGGLESESGVAGS